MPRKLFSDEPGMEYLAAAVLLQMINCARRGNSCSTYFMVELPTLDDLMSVLGNRALIFRM